MLWIDFINKNKSTTKSTKRRKSITSITTDLNHIHHQTHVHAHDHALTHHTIQEKILVHHHTLADDREHVQIITNRDHVHNAIIQKTENLVEVRVNAKEQTQTKDQTVNIINVLDVVIQIINLQIVQKSIKM